MGDKRMCGGVGVYRMKIDPQAHNSEKWSGNEIGEKLFYKKLLVIRQLIVHN
jgi:hypothetical protein